jgi:hypothetical protein
MPMIGMIDLSSAGTLTYIKSLVTRVESVLPPCQRIIVFCFGEDD